MTPKTRKLRKVDIRFEGHGSIVLIRALTEAGTEWLDQNVGTTDCLTFGGAIACEPRYVSDIMEGATADGLEVEGCLAS